MPKVLQKTHKRRTYQYRSTIKPRRRRKQKKASLQSILTMIVALACALLLSAYIISFFTEQRSVYHHVQNVSPLAGDTTYSVIGTPSINAQFIDKVLSYYHSPAQGKGQTLYDDGVKYNIDSAYALAFFVQESHCGTRGVATETHSLGNIRATAGHPEYQGYRLYTTWEEGFEDWYRLIANDYIEQRGLTTVDQIIPVYAPATDNNNEQQYIHTVEDMVSKWRQGTLIM